MILSRDDAGRVTGLTERRKFDDLRLTRACRRSNDRFSAAADS
ncbi:MAG TPA: hypothetical protein VLB69_12560 [Rudaea sp.]|nr:hypothetical protein [Rudaea sp.]